MPFLELSELPPDDVWLEERLLYDEGSLTHSPLSAAISSFQEHVANGIAQGFQVSFLFGGDL